ncbi:MAG: type II secretion system protein [Anaerovoracaceae bacterium]
MNKLMKKDKKGFTLIEVIVVLVILAILAAILVPSMIGWINKANEKTAIVEGRSVLLACQTIASEKYKTYAGTKAESDFTDTADALTLAELKSPAAISAAKIDTSGKVASFTYNDSSDKYTVTYTAAGGFTSVKK